MLGRKHSQQIRNQRHVQDGHNAQVKRTAQLTGLAPEFLETFLQLAQYRSGVFLENQAGRRKENTLATSLKESDTEAGFEVADLLRDAGLGNAKAISGAAEVSGLGYGQEIPQVTHFNRIVHRATSG
jgi:hypothetical protein